MKVTNQECKSVFKTKETTMKSYEKCVKLLSYGPCVALIGSLLIGSPKSFAQNDESSPSEPLRLTVAPQTSSRIAMKTLPKATCLLHVDGDNDTSHSFKLFSDDEGMIRFNVNPRQEADEVAAFAVDCTTDGQSRTFGLELRPSPTPRLDMPAPAVEKRTPKATDFIRPALTKAEALQLSDHELVKREYPRRPNPNRAPEAFADWLKAVTQPARRVDARQVATEIRASNWEVGRNWSGFELRNPVCGQCGGYDQVYGVWYVPTVGNPIANQTTNSSLWIGLDGDAGFTDLWQAGTDQQSWNDSWWIFSFDFTSYDAWTEFLPRQQTGQTLPNFNVSPGDEMLTIVEVDNGNGEPQLWDEMFANAVVEDITQHEYAFVSNCLGQVIDGNCTNLDQINIVGTEAEWIMEAPGVAGAPPGTFYDLADYKEAWMYDAYALETTGGLTPTNIGLINYLGANNQMIFMLNNSTGHLLSAPFVWNNTTIEYVWYNWY